MRVTLTVDQMVGLYRDTNDMWRPSPLYRVGAVIELDDDKYVISERKTYRNVSGYVIYYKAHTLDGSERSLNQSDIVCRGVILSA